MTRIKNLIGGDIRQYGIVGALVVIVAMFAYFTGGKILYSDNVASLVGQNAYVMILAIGMVMVIIAGHIDLSVGSIVAFLGGIVAIAMNQWGLPWLLAVVIGIAFGALVGAWQGFWVAYVGIPAFIVTLAGMLIFRGLAIVIVGVTLAGFPQPFVDISNGYLPNVLGYVANRDVVTLTLGAVVIGALVLSQVRARMDRAQHGLAVESFVAFVTKLVVFSAVVVGFAWILSGSTKGSPIVLVIVGVLVVAYSFVMGKTVFGRHIYAIGGNLHAAILSGVDTKKVNFWVFVNIGVLAGVAGVVTTSRAGAATALAGQNYELDAIAACFIGGTAVTGGVGRVSGAMVGALIMGVLNMGLSIMNVDAAWVQAIKGLVLLLAVAFDLVNKRRSTSV